MLLTACNIFLFAQSNRTTDVTTPKVEKTPVIYKIPNKPVATLNDYYTEFNAQNLIAPKLYGQFPPSSTNITSQKFEAANSVYDSNAADDFVVPANKIWNINSVSVRGNAIVNIYPTSYNVTFYSNSSTNFPNTVIRTENVVLAAGSVNPTLALATPLFLTEGKYWVSVQAVMNLTGGGQWFWETYTDAGTLSAPFAWTNPGNGFATPCNTAWNTASICLSGQLKDLQFSLDGVESNPCKTITGRISTADPTQTPRIFRDAIASICSSTKVFPGTTGSGSFHYKSYTVQNTSATPNCVTITLKNSDITNNVHLSAYNGAFNPANLSQNYIGDIGTSSSNGIIQKMDITIPGNTTINIIASEVIANTTYSDDFTINVISQNCGNILKTLVSTLNPIMIYPNPTHSVLFVSGMKVMDASVFDVSGKLIPLKSSESQINVEGLMKGNYLLQIKDKDGKIHQDKFIKN
jgi:hypothetical protein